ncbi:MAG TPA: hypothetical protein VJS65_11990, partial [Verrucomicrobiae bacterium]|nr:hypothetical protein [Verrucomicrobiae bacterium]
MSRLGRRRLVLGAVLVGVLALIGYQKLTYVPAKPLPGAETVSEARRPIWIPPPEESPPESGQGEFFFDRPTADSRLHIVPRGEQGHVVLKVEAASDAKLLCWIFVRQGESAETPIPAGSYRLKLACGQKWYGNRHLFGPGGSYSAITTEVKIPTHTDYT